MKILLISEWFLPHSGGMETILYNTIRHSKGDDYIVFAPQMPASQEFDDKQDFEIVRSPLWQTRGIGGRNIFLRLYVLSRLILRSLVLIRSRKADAVFFSSPHLYMGIWAFCLKTLTRKPLLFFVFAEIIDRNLADRRWGVRPLSFFMMLALRKADRLIAGSNYTVDKLLGWGVDAERIIRNFPCVDLEKFKPGLDYQGILKKHGIGGKKIILTVSRLEKSKGIDLIIQALPAILKQFPDVVYLIAGSGTEENILRALTAKLRLEDKVIFAGDIPAYTENSELPAYYNACDIFIVANHKIGSWKETEGFGIVFIEAGACAKAVIAGKSGGTIDAVIDVRTGLLINAEEGEEIVNAVIKLFSDATLRDTLGRNGRLRAEQEFSWDKYVERIRL
jgi:phosphatidylinositol alpha-1,6-mannosyltransferase